MLHVDISKTPYYEQNKDHPEFTEFSQQKMYDVGTLLMVTDMAHLSHANFKEFIFRCEFLGLFDKYYPTDPFPERIKKCYSQYLSFVGVWVNVTQKSRKEFLKRAVGNMEHSLDYKLKNVSFEPKEP